MKSKLRRIGQRVGPHLGKAVLLCVGFVLGALVFATRSCSTHSRHEVPESVQGSGDEQTVWTCSMHPQIRQPEPGQCPICGMDLIPVSTGDGAETSQPNQIVLSERARALAKLRTVPVRRRADATAELRLLGRIEPDETTLKTVTAWIGGRIDRLHVSATGARVRVGQVIATLYSPEVFAAHQDLLVAKRQAARMGQGPEAIQSATRAALEAARNRLRLLGVPEAELARMETQEQPTRATAIRSPYRGTVLERLATEGAYVTTGTPLYRIANLGKLWVQLDAYESDLARISVGQTVQVRVEALAGEDFEGKVTFIEPTLDPTRRTAQVRVEVDNEDGRLRPGMFAETSVTTEAQGKGETKQAGGEELPRSPLVVPATAPLFTGRRAVVYVELQDSNRVVYEARQVRLGPRLGEYYPVVAGLSEGERVVARGAFAIDADLQIRGGSSMMTLPDDSEQGAWDGAIELPVEERAKLAPVVEAYLATQTALAEDDLAQARQAAQQLSRALSKVELRRPSQAVKEWATLSVDLRSSGDSLGKAVDLEQARAVFEELSAQIEELVRRFGNPLDEPLHVAFCPMAFGSRGARWIQRGGAIDNAYFGESMRTCGEVRGAVAPGAYLESAPTLRPGERTPEPAREHQH